jgi:hypothetical protein
LLPSSISTPAWAYALDFIRSTECSVVSGQLSIPPVGRACHCKHCRFDETVLSSHTYTAMTNDEIHSAIFKQRWRKCTLSLVDGEKVTVDHPDYLFMPPERNWVLWVWPKGKGMKFIPTEHIAAIDLERQVATSPNKG